MTLGSLFDRIGGWLLAARHAGVTPVWASEIEPFPCSVTAYHFPDVTKMGDITQIDPDEIEPGYGFEVDRDFYKAAKEKMLVLPEVQEQRLFA